MFVNPKGHSKTKARQSSLIVHSVVALILGFAAVGAGYHIIETYKNSTRAQLTAERLIQEDGKVVEVATSYLKKKEGFKATPYRCSAGAKTIGYGDTAYMKEFPNAKSITEQEAANRLEIKVKELKMGLDSYSVEVGNKTITYAESLNQNQKAALISFVYNLGDSAYKLSTLKEKVDQKIIIETKLKKDYSRNPQYKDRLAKDLKYTNVLIQREFLRWSKIKSGKTYAKLESLEERRREEARMFLASS